MEIYAPKTARGYKIQFKFALNWLYDNHYSSFSGNQLLPAIHCEDRNSLISCYSADEAARILGSVDISTPNGKLEYSILCLLAYPGIRASDIAALGFENIDWNSGILSFTQFKNIKYKHSIGYKISESELYRMKELDVFFERYGITGPCITKEMYDKYHSFRLIVFFCYCCGLRKSEAVFLKVKDVDFQTGKLNI